MGVLRNRLLNYHCQNPENGNFWTSSKFPGIPVKELQVGYGGFSRFFGNSRWPWPTIPHPRGEVS